MKNPIYNKPPIIDIPRNKFFPPEVQLQRLRAVVEGELTDRQREIFESYYYEGKTMQELAELYGVNKSSIHTTIYRAIRRIERCLKY
jgi:RNA polymerase sigma factor, sigma-70 family